MFFARVPILAPPWLTVAAFLATLGPGSASLGVAAAAAAEPAPAPLRLVGTAGDVEFHQFVVEDHELFVRTADGAKQPVPRGMKWRLEGDLRANGDRVDWRTSYRIVTRPSIDATPDIRTRSHALVRTFRDDEWPTHQEKEAAVVLVWLLGGLPARVEVIPVPPPALYSSNYVVGHVWELRPEETSGVAVTLWWREGKFVPPKPAFGHPHLQEALAVMHLGSTAEFAALLPRSKIEREWLLHEAAGGSRAEIVEVLLKSAASARSELGGWTTLHDAAMNGRRANARLLGAAGASPWSENDRGHSAAEFALAYGHLDLAMEWLGAREKRLRQAALEIAVAQGNVEHTRTLLERPGKIAWSQFPAEALANAVSRDDPALLDCLRAAGAPMKEHGATETAEIVPEGPTVRAASIVRFRERGRLMRQMTWRADYSRGVGLLAKRDPGYEDLWARVGRNSGGSSPHDLWLAASMIVEPDGKPSSVQLLDAVSELYAREALDMLRRSTFVPEEVDGVPVRTRTSLMIFAQP